MDDSSSIELSSEPSTTTASGADDFNNPENVPQAVTYNNAQTKKKKKDNILFPILTIVLLELVLPICYLINSITTQSIMGLLNIIILVVNVIITNLTKTSITGHKAILSVELIYNIILLACASTIGYRADAKTNKVIRLFGLDFNNTVVKSPKLTIIISSIAVFLELVAAILITKTKPEQMIYFRSIFFSSMGWIFSADFIWTFCLAYAGASNTSYLFMPLLIYFLYISITMGILGRPCVPHIVQYFVYGYAILYSMYLFFQVSYIGQQYSISKQIKFKMLANRKYDYIVLSVNIIQIWLSTQLCFAFQRHGKAPKIPEFLVNASDFVLVCAFVCVLIYSVYFPCYISVLWIIIVYITAFFNLNAAKHVFFRIISIVHNLGFSVIYVTIADLYPISKLQNADGSDTKTLTRLKEFGLYHYNDHFNYTVLGFFLAALLAQIGRIIHYKDDSTSLDDEENLDPVEKKEKETPFWIRIIKLIFKWIVYIVVQIFKYLTAAAIIILALTYGYAENKIIFHCVWVIALCISVLGLYNRVIFEFIKFFVGITIITATFFEANVLDFKSIENFLKKTGLAIPEGEASLIEYLWPYMVILFLTVVITNMESCIFTLPPTGTVLLFWFLCLLHILYLYLFKFNVFSLAYLIVGIWIFYCQVLSQINLLKIAICFSGFTVSLHQGLLMLSEYEQTRNFLSELLPKAVVDISIPTKPGKESVLLAITQFTISLTYRNLSVTYSKQGIYTKGILEEIKAALRSFYFYISWIFMFFFSIANDYPTIIKLIISIFFLLGSKVARLFNKMVKGQLLFNMVFLFVEMYIEIFPEQFEKQRNILEYIGLYFVDGPYTIEQRNSSMTWQLLFILVSILNIIAEHAEPTDPKFDNCLPMRLYRAFYSMLHNWLPVFVNISLCISTLYNPTIFGLFSYIILNIVQFKSEVLKRGAIMITFLFNCCFVFQYMVWLGLPKHATWSLLENFDEKWDLWLEFFSLKNIEIPALLTNMVTAFILTFYLQFRELAISYDMAFNDLPKWMQTIVLFICTNIFEIIETIAIGVSIFIPTVDGIFFFLLVGSLFFATLLFNFDSHKTISIHLWGIFLVILARWISRIPYFIDKGMGKWMTSLFGLPFQGDSASEYWWIILFSLESLVIHVMETPMFQQCRKESVQRLAFRFIRVRQLKVIERLNQEIVERLQAKKIEDIFSIAESSTRMSKSMLNMIPGMSYQEPMLAQKKLNDDKKEKQEELKKKLEEGNYNPEEEEEEEQEEKKKTLKQLIIQFYEWAKESIFYPILNRLLMAMIKVVPINSEAGINVLTLNSLHNILRRYASAMRIAGTYTLSAHEMNFIKKLPPSIVYQISAVGEIFGFPPLNREMMFELCMRYLGLFIRRLSLPFLVLISVIYFYVRQNLWSILILFYVFVVFCGTKLYAKPNQYRLFYFLMMLMMLVRAVSTVDIIANLVYDYQNSVSGAQVSVDFIDLLGANPGDDSIVEIFVFLIGNWFIIDNLKNATVFMPKHYTETVFGGDNKLEGFPDKYFYNFDNPDRVLGLSTKSGGTIWSQIKSQANSMRIFPSTQYLIVMAIDVFAFIIMLFGIDGWTTSSRSSSNTNAGGISLYLVFSLIFSAIFILIYYFLRISNNFLGLFFFNTIQVICVLLFFKIVCLTKNSALNFYMFCKFVSILIIFHDTFSGKLFANFSFPDIKKEGRKMVILNNIVKLCPFIYEIYTLLVWMSRTTYVSFKHFFVMNELKLYLENQMVDNYRKEHEEGEMKPQHNMIIGGLIILVIIILLFGPLFFLVKSKIDTNPNPVNHVSLEWGIGSIGYLYKSYGQIKPMTTSMQNTLIDIPGYDWFKELETSSLFIVDFPIESQMIPEANSTILPFLSAEIDNTHSLKTYWKLTTMFEYETSIALSTEIVTDYSSPDFTNAEKRSLRDFYASQNGTTATYVDIPRAHIFQFSLPTTEYGNENYSISFQNNKCFIRVTENTNDFFGDATIRMVFYSQPVPTYDAMLSVGTFTTSLIGIYILIIFTFGEVLRERVLGSYEGLWIERMKHPEVLYQYIIAIEAFKIVEALDKEYMMIEKLLDTVKSKETCIQMTNDFEDEESDIDGKKTDEDSLDSPQQKKADPPKTEELQPKTEETQPKTEETQQKDDDPQNKENKISPKRSVSFINIDDADKEKENNNEEKKDEDNKDDKEESSISKSSSLSSTTSSKK